MNKDLKADSGPMVTLSPKHEVRARAHEALQLTQQAAEVREP